MKSIAVIGAGITGITTAHALLERGFDVTPCLIATVRGDGNGFANGGQQRLKRRVWTVIPRSSRASNEWHRATRRCSREPPNHLGTSWMAEFMSNITTITKKHH
jgi:D-amino-acid dehydrogenase